MRGVYAFHGCDSKCGVTMVAQSAAQQLAAANRDKSVLLISLCGRRNSQYVRKEAASIDEYRDRIGAEVDLKRCELENRKIAENLYYIDGIEKEEEGRFYFPEMTIAFLKKMKEQFDYIIVDTGSEMDNGLTVGGLMGAELNFMVLAQNDACLERYRKLRKLYDALSFSFDAYVINKFRDRDVYSLSYIKKHIINSYKEVFTICDTGRAREAEFERRTFTEMKDRRFSDGIGRLVARIEKSSGIGA